MSVINRTGVRYSIQKLLLSHALKVYVACITALQQTDFLIYSYTKKHAYRF